jgi:hypothetical protein
VGIGPRQHACLDGHAHVGAVPVPIGPEQLALAAQRVLLARRLYRSVGRKGVSSEYVGQISRVTPRLS